ncbi:MAG: peptidylprolyl isomerase [Gammaproteobacteria bacterium]|nr:peptidylprolyl isomerase [Gammaproteobacteria bacterium]
MISISRSNKVGTRFAALALSLSVALATGCAPAQQETVQELDRSEDSELFSVFAASQLRKPLEQASPEERASAMEQLTDLYLIASTDRAVELGKGENVRAQIELQRVVTLFNAFAVDFLESNPATEEEILAAYSEQTALVPTEFKARHILVETEDAAKGLIEELQGGADFVELAKQHSTGPTGPAGGDLGWFAPQTMVKEFSDAVAVLDDGGFTPAPVQTQFGWHVILREDSREGTAPPLDGVREVIQRKIEQEKFSKYVEDLRGGTEEQS